MYFEQKDTGTFYDYPFVSPCPGITPVHDRPLEVGPQPRFCVFTLLFGFFCWCRGFCHRTESYLFLFPLNIQEIWAKTEKNHPNDTQTNYAGTVPDPPLISPCLAIPVPVKQAIINMDIH